MPTANTDNKRHLFVMVFVFVPASKTAPADRGTRTSRQYFQLNFCTLTNFWLRSNLYRDTAPVPATNFITGDKFADPNNLVPRHTYSSQNLYLDGKKCAIPSFPGRKKSSTKEPGQVVGRNCVG
jgi:hypothetical protein